MKELKKVRKQMVKSGLDVTEVDRDIDLLKGTRDSKGLFFALDVTDDANARKKKAEADIGEQRDITDERDYATHDKTTEQVREYVADIAADETMAPAAKVQKFNALEDGERERDGGPRESVLKVIRSARSPIAKKVKQIALVDK